MDAEDTREEVEELARTAGVTTEKMAKMIAFAGGGWDSEDEN